ncbi:p1/s1 nuclease, putative [Plasmodium vinckei lentum]|uniref:p1/s1 nuclease, putative n=1 Tax=Plasmodium vinckei lentum TaxID=138297 RepID=A0A6V7S8Q1_PLAVN|nr:p1/s1 nuclease, putative [Plasmodium vinckei lentum]
MGFIKYLISCGLFSLLLLKEATCWSDEGHMLISAIAYEGLDDNEKKILTKILENYKEDNDFNNHVYAAVWPDHIKYYEHPIDTTKRMDGIDLMDRWHYINVPYNPTHIDLDMYHKEYYKTTDNSLTMTRRIFHNLKSFEKKKNYGSYFSYNFQLRYFIHVFGDMHQPLHTTTFFNKNFIQGDYGGTAINVSYNHRTEKLHHLCDCVFHARDKRWPHATVEEVTSDARDLMKTYPPEYFGERIDNGMDENEFLGYIVEDSYEQAVKHVYSGFPFETLNRHTSYDLSNAYVINLKKVLNEQIALGGYRLTRYLKIMLANVPDDLLQTGTA